MSETKGWIKWVCGTIITITIALCYFSIFPHQITLNIATDDNSVEIMKIAENISQHYDSEIYILKDELNKCNYENKYLQKLADLGNIRPPSEGAICFYKYVAVDCEDIGILWDIPEE